ncbi:RNA polymerase III subunit [Scheffersomyces stipitis CBS 6054]|uniref:RNA polymerase III subunit n=1 Tax=Scheffersomyces stipitis (strain ATCC 58785 / CBS 6054 / NBRC 10063 / NRRL Y-11545) TaxID=322104 RepID=A3LWH4_PICST|nr:RNA polymerase III subunit [Scheffersomyces stipitis CBS 6054]ABN67278.1 RNA polymerase III subunit [Scheffersomyces stipitis CBS 6054]KAG2734411.1 hypothetical protein G9P44_002417 [Scheffersomyces stipitis]
MSATSSSLFVQDEDDHNMSESELNQTSGEITGPFDPEQPQEPEEDDDPIIDSIPLVLNTLPSSSQSLHVLQYPGRPGSRPLSDGSYRASFKQESKYLEVKVPLDTSKFFNVSKTEDWGEDIAVQGLQGVLNKSEGGMYVGQIIEENGSKKIVLTPVDSTAQLRTAFKYIDDLDASTQAQRKAENSDSSKSSNIQILQTAAKSGSQITSSEGFGSSLGESLRHVKKFDEEQWSTLKWETVTSDVSQNLRSTLANSADGIELSTVTTMDDYIVELTKD